MMTVANGRSRTLGPHTAHPRSPVSLARASESRGGWRIHKAMAVNGLRRFMSPRNVVGMKAAKSNHPYGGEGR